MSSLLPRLAEQKKGVFFFLFFPADEMPFDTLLPPAGCIKTAGGSNVYVIILTDAINLRNYLFSFQAIDIHKGFWPS